MTEQEKDAEIERLKAELLKFRNLMKQGDADSLARKNQLIAELADAWDDPESHPWSYIESLQQRAREATKDENEKET